MTELPVTSRFDRAFFCLLADWLAVAVVIALPWSTSATGICIGAWLLALLPTLDWPSVRRELLTPAGGLPVALWGLGVVGMLWADVDWAARWGGLSGFHKLLVVPLLLAQFRRSEAGIWAVFGLFASSILVLFLSFVLVLTPGLAWRGHQEGVPVHDYIFQGSLFLICAFGALGWAWDDAIKRRRVSAIVIALLGALFLANFGFATVSRASLVVAPILVLLLGWRMARWRGVIGACVAGVLVGAAFWSASPNLRARVGTSIEEMREYRASNEITSTGLHAAFLKEALQIVASAPILGHGTGTITDEYRHITATGTGVAAVIADNPHNQTLGVAIELGLVGGVILWAMWISHFRLFLGSSTASWIGMVVVAENVVSSAMHSHLFDFSNGWLYVFAVGVLGSVVLRERTMPSNSNR